MEPVQLLPYRSFSVLELGRFLRSDLPLREPIVSLEAWEFMGGTWHGHASGFSEFLYHDRCPDELGSLALDASALPSEVFSAALATLRLPLYAGMDSAAIHLALGKPLKTLEFVQDRVSFEYSLGEPEAYYVSLTVKHDGGLTYVVVSREDILALCDADA